jgi:hypothetical protein
MLESLLESGLASDDDRIVARKVYLAFARSSLSLVTQQVDDADVVVDDEGADEKGGPR